ncbi:MAG: NUDIX hydrolase [Planctomycetota bacterium]
MEPSYTHAGGVVIKFEGEDRSYLIVRSSTNPKHWVFPKGHIDPGESAESAALREVREEAGVQAEILSALGAVEFTRADETIRVLYFAMRYESSVEADEDRAIKWCSYQEAMETLSFDDSRKILEKAHAIIA